MVKVYIYSFRINMYRVELLLVCCFNVGTLLTIQSIGLPRSVYIVENTMLAWINFEMKSI